LASIQALITCLQKKYPSLQPSFFLKKRLPQLLKRLLPDTLNNGSSTRFLGLLFAFVLIPLICSSLITYLLYQYQDLLNSHIEILLLFTLLSIFTMTCALTSTTFIAIITGYFFSWQGLPALLLAYPIASILGLLLGKYLNQWLVGELFFQQPPYDRIFERMKNQQIWLIAFIRLSPVLPFAMMNIALSTVRLHYGQYLIGTILGMLPRTLVFFVAGKNVQELWQFLDNPSLDGSYQLLPILLVLVSTVGLFFLFKKNIQALVREKGD